MTHKSVYDHFKENIPTYAEIANACFPNGKNSIRVRLVNKKEFIFTYNGKDDWRFETMDSFLAKRS